MLALRDLSWVLCSQSLEAETLLFLRRLLGRVHIGCFWDVGANIGYFSWMIRSHSPGVQLRLFEPDPTNAALLFATLQRNQIRGCEVLKCALSDADGTATFLRDEVSGATGHLAEVDTSLHEGTIQAAYSRANQGKGHTVECRSMDSLVTQGFPAPDLIKMDVEGAEALVLKGGTCMFQEGTMVLFEVSDRSAIDLLRQWQYEVWLVDACSHNYFAAPKQRSEMAQLMADFCYPLAGEEKFMAADAS